MLLVNDTREHRRRDSEVALRPWLEIVGAVARLLAANSLASAAVAWLFLVAAVARFADGINRAVGQPCGGMHDYKQ
jgi:hypothetical protein